VSASLTELGRLKRLNAELVGAIQDIATDARHGGEPWWSRDETRKETLRAIYDRAIKAIVEGRGS
jgi:hypothetical protein